MIRSPIGSRIVVEAGPGYGKTDVACARVAYLLESVEPTEILLLSFTRTAVREMRNRVQQLARTVDRAGHVSIRTLDSFNAELRRVCTESPLGGNFEQTVTDVLEVLANRKHPRHDQAVEALTRFKHILVDEAQDLVGVRSALIAHLLRCSGAGWTVFYDAAQAIYGWAETGEGHDVGKKHGTVLEEVAKGGQSFETVSLKTLHRTSNKKLATLQTSIRDIVLKGTQKSRADAVRAALRAAASKPMSRPELVARLRSLKAVEAEKTLVLYRTRVEALQLSHDLAEAGVKHRLRLGRLPSVVAPWVAACLNASPKPKLSEADFATIWSDIATGSPALTRGWDAERAWRALVRASLSGKLVEMTKVVDAISLKMRTEELFNRDIGPGGPIIGTIHGSKGREAEYVVAHFSNEGWEKEDSNEEARVLYVGITRAKEDIELCATEKPGTGLIDGRAWKGLPGANYLLEIGQPDDLDPFASCGTLEVSAGLQQQALASYPGEMIPVAAFAQKVADEWRWLLLPNEADKKAGKRVGQAGLDSALPLGALSPWIGKVFLEVAKRKRGSAPKGFLFGLYWYDTTTVAVREDDPRLSSIPKVPWGQSRIWLAPVVMGFGFGKAKIAP